MNSDHIIQSVVCMLAIDGRIDDQERVFLQQLQQRLGIPAKALNQALQQAKLGKGRVKLPEGPTEQQRVFEVLVHAALADGTVTPEERKILDAVGTKIGLRKDLIEHSINFYVGEARKARQTGQSEDASPLSSPPPVPQEPTTKICPKCGAEQERDRTDCIRCGIIFSRCTSETASEKPEAPPRKPLYPEYDDEAGKASEQLEQLQSFSVLLNHAGSVALIVAVIIVVGFGLVQMPERLSEK